MKLTPLPIEWGRSIDGAQQLALQCALHPKQSFGYIVLSVSAQDGTKDTFRTELGGMVTDTHTDTRHRIISYGDKDPTKFPETEWSPVEIMDELSELGVVKLIQGFPDMVINEQTTLEPFPKGFERTGVLEELDAMYRVQMKQGNLNGIYGKRTGNPRLWNAYQAIARGCMEHLNFKPNADLAKRMRSIGVTEFMGGFDGTKYVGRDAIGQEGIERFQRFIVAPNWWEDYATYKTRCCTVNGDRYDDHLYHLQKFGADTLL